MANKWKIADVSGGSPNTTFPYMRFQKDGETLYSPTFETTKGAGRMYDSTLMLPTTTSFYVQGSLIDKVGHRRPRGYENSTISNGLTVGTDLSCRLENGRIYVDSDSNGIGGVLLYDGVDIDFTDAVINLQVGSSEMHNLTSPAYNYLLDIGHMFYILKLQGSTNYTVRTRPNPSGTVLDFSIGELSTEANIICVFEDDNLIVYVDGEKRLETTGGNYPRSAQSARVGIASCHTRVGVGVHTDCYFYTCSIGTYKSSVWQGNASPSMEYLELASRAKGYYHIPSKYAEDNHLQNMLVVRNFEGAIPYDNEWDISSD